MSIKELQEELVEKFSLISMEYDEASVERALEIINQLGKGHINETLISIGKIGVIDSAGKIGRTRRIGRVSRNLTVLDCLIIFNSDGDNPNISARPRVANSVVEELKNAIRKIGGRTSEELGLSQYVYYDQDECQKLASDLQALVQRRLKINALGQASRERVYILERVSKRASGQELQTLERRILKLQTLSEATEQGLRTLSAVLERNLYYVLGMKVVETLLQTTEQSVLALEQTLERESQISGDSNIQIMKKVACTICAVGSLYLHANL